MFMTLLPIGKQEMIVCYFGVSILQPMVLMRFYCFSNSWLLQEQAVSLLSEKLKDLRVGFVVVDVHLRRCEGYHTVLY